MSDLIIATYLCPCCGEENETTVDPSGGTHQSYTEDCFVCCRPILLNIVISGENEAILTVEFEG